MEAFILLIVLVLLFISLSRMAGVKRIMKIILSFLILSPILSHAQSFQFRADLAPVPQSGYHRVALPPAVVGHLNNTLGDIRLYDNLLFSANNVDAPQYDLATFQASIPANAPEIGINKIGPVEEDEAHKNSFWSSRWLIWVALGLGLVVLGLLSYRMVWEMK
ncbi:MAG: hypothetical protein LH609_23500 [Rudanella sp.]|nr:hypothetical protein [Rudanella sp.]